MKKTVTFDLVASVCDDLIARGERVSLRIVREITKGSLETVLEFLQQYRQQQKARQPLIGKTLSPELQKAILNEYVRLNAERDKKIDEEYQETANQIQELETLAVASEAKIDELTDLLDQEKANHQATIITKEKQLSALEAKLLELEAQLNEAKRWEVALNEQKENNHALQVKLAILETRLETKHPALQEAKLVANAPEVKK